MMMLLLLLLMLYNAVTGAKLAVEYLEDAAIEEDVNLLLTLLARYSDISEAVNYGVSEMDRILMADGK